MKIKVCGMRDTENIRQVCALGIDYIGMIFWDGSSRNVTMLPTHAGIIPDRASLSPQEREPVSWSKDAHDKRPPLRVGVFVDEMPQNIITRVVSFGLDVIQLHGHESPTLIRNLRSTIDPDLRPGLKVWKAVAVAKADDLLVTEQYEDCVDCFVFDTKAKVPGGSGEQFDWSVLEAYKGTVPFLLSGGIGPNDAERVRAFHHERCIGIDLNSRFETAPAVKDVELLKKFLSALAHIQS